MCVLVHRFAHSHVCMVALNVDFVYTHHIRGAISCAFQWFDYHNSDCVASAGGVEGEGFIMKTYPHIDSDYVMVFGSTSFDSIYSHI